MTTTDNGFDVFGAIEAKWLQLNGPNGPLGHPVAPEVDTVDGLGRAQNFQAGVISWHRGSPDGAFATYGLIGERWIAIGREAFGYPITDEATTGDQRGRYNHYRKFNPDGSIFGDSSIFFLPGAVGAHEIYGGIRDLWAHMGWEKSNAGFPVSAERDRRDAPGREQQFEHGRIVWRDGTAEYDPHGIQPQVHLAAIDDHVAVSGEGFTPGVVLGLKLTVKYEPNPPDPGPTETTQRSDTVTTNADGAFFGVTFGGLPPTNSITFIEIDATDPATGITASKSLP